MRRAPPTIGVLDPDARLGRPRPAPDPHELARAALGRGAWAEARAAYEALLASGDEGPETLEGLSWAAWWQADATAVFGAREAAYRRYRERGDKRGAARMATWLGTDHVDFRGELAIANGWLARARRLLEGHPDSAEAGWLRVHEAQKCLYLDDTAAALALAAEALELGRRLPDPGLEIMARATEGLTLATEGRVAEGMRCLDEAAAGAFAGEAEDPWVINWCCCYVIYACERVRDYDRASQWCRRAVEHAERNGMESFNRLCRAHHAGVLIWRGLWREAESELLAARDLLEATRPPWAAEAVVRLSELRRRQGRAQEAEELLGQAEGHPLAVVGRAELALDRGDAAEAVDCLERFLRDVPERGRTQRALALDVLVRARLGLGDREGARAALSELRGHAEAVSGDAMWGAVALAAGELEWAEGAADGARRAFQDAVSRFARAGAPFEAGRARLRLAEALAALGRGPQAAGEAAAAARALAEIGAGEASRAQALVARLSGRPPKLAITAREREVLAMVAAGRGDRAIAEALVLSEHTVHRHVANIMGKLGCTSRSAAVAEALRRELL